MRLKLYEDAVKAKTRKGSADGSDAKSESADDPASASEQKAPSVQHVLQNQSETRSVRQRRASRAQPDAQRTPSRRSSNGYNVTSDLPEQLHVRFERARQDQTEQPSGAPFAGKVTRINFMAFIWPTAFFQKSWLSIKKSLGISQGS